MLGAVDWIEVATDIAKFGGAAAVIGGAIAWGLKWRDEVKENRRQLKVMWNAWISRARIEGEKSGVLTLTPSGQPDILADRVRQLFNPMKRELRQWYLEFDSKNERHRTKLSFAELTLAIESRFGPRIVEEVCRPGRIADLSCLHAAAIICQEPSGDSDIAYRS